VVLPNARPSLIALVPSARAHAGKLLRTAFYVQKRPDIIDFPLWGQLPSKIRTRREIVNT
jgi:hypothetical protein